jgi:hypothetical protein
MHLKRSGKRNLMLAGYFSHPVTFLYIRSDTHGILLLPAANGCLFASCKSQAAKTTARQKLCNKKLQDSR